MLELLDAAAQTVDIEHPLHRGQGGVKGGDVGLTVGFHSRPRYRRPCPRLALRSPSGAPAQLRRAALAQPPRAAAGHKQKVRVCVPYHVAIVGSGPSGFFAAASLLKAADASEEIDVGRRHAGDAADTVGSGALRRRARPPEDQVDQQAIREDRRRSRASASSATSWSASTSSPANSPSATTP